MSWLSPDSGVIPDPPHTKQKLYTNGIDIQKRITKDTVSGDRAKMIMKEKQQYNPFAHIYCLNKDLFDICLHLLYGDKVVYCIFTKYLLKRDI